MSNLTVTVPVWICYSGALQFGHASAVAPSTNSVRVYYRRIIRAGDILILPGAVILPGSNCSSNMGNIRWFIETLVFGSYLGSLLLALTKNLHPERTGLINRWHYFFFHFCMPRLILPALILLILDLFGFIKL